MKLLLAAIMCVLVPSVGSSEWQVLKEPQRWMIQEPARPDITKPQARPQDKQKSTDDVPSPILKKTEPDSPNTQAGSNQASKNEDSQWWWNTVRGEIKEHGLLIVALGFGQLIIMFLQFLIGVRSANAAKASAQVARDALEIVERPSLAAEKWEFDIHGNANAPVAGIVCTLRNTGRTRATVIEGGISFVSWEKTPPQKEMGDFWRPQKGPFTVHPQEVLNYLLSFSENEHNQIRGMGGPRERMYYYGRISYTDEFNNLHLLRFCIVENGELIPVKEGGYNYTETIKKQEEEQPT